jgi:hypothetical protein
MILLSKAKDSQQLSAQLALQNSDGLVFDLQVLRGRNYAFVAKAIRLRFSYLHNSRNLFN